jgi:hypothetical protein
MSTPISLITSTATGLIWDLWGIPAPIGSVFLAVFPEKALRHLAAPHILNAHKEYLPFRFAFGGFAFNGEIHFLQSPSCLVFIIP